MYTCTDSRFVCFLACAPKQSICGLNLKLLTDISARLASWAAPAAAPAVAPVTAASDAPPQANASSAESTAPTPAETPAPLASLPPLNPTGARADTDCIGDLFVQFGPFLKMYTQFASNSEEAMRLLRDLQENNSNFSAFTAECMANPRCRGQSLDSFLIMPIQRIPRYLLLLAELKKHTPLDHPDYAHLGKAETLIGVTAKHLNEQVRARYGAAFCLLETFVRSHSTLLV